MCVRLCVITHLVFHFSTTLLLLLLLCVVVVVVVVVVVIVVRFFLLSCVCVDVCCQIGGSKTGTRLRLFDARVFFRANTKNTGTSAFSFFF